MNNLMKADQFHDAVFPAPIYFDACVVKSGFVRCLLR